MKLDNIKLAAALMLVGTATACTDTWDDHYAERSYGSTNGSLLQAITSNERLSNFGEVLKATGYDKTLGSSQVFTVFAPTNDYFTEADRDAVIALYNSEKESGVKDNKNEAVVEFLQNHIALYNYSTSEAAGDTTIMMMNGKKVKFSASSFGGNNYDGEGYVQTGNGLLYAINGQSTFEPNLFEYLDKDADLDSVKNFIYKYNYEEFMADQSVPGEIIDGKTHFLDSVTVTTNEILSSSTWLNAQLNNEDSTYVFLVPTNATWDKMLKQNEKMFQYDKKISERDSFMYIYPRINIIRGAAFSANVNKGLLNAGAALDSVKATTAMPYEFRQMLYGSYDKRIYTYMKPFASNGIFSGTTDIAVSNGVIKKTSDWKIDRSQTFLYDIVMEGESNRTVDSLNLRTATNLRGNTAPPKYVSVASTNKFYNKVSGNGYLELTPSGTSAISKALFNITNVLSNVPYEVYVVMAPAEAGDTLAPESERVPTKFRCSLQCNGMDGGVYYMLNTGEFSTKYPVYTNQVAKTGVKDPGTYSNTPVLVAKDGVSVDSVYVGTFTFPTCSYNTEPQVKMLIDCRTSNSDYNAGRNSKTLRIDCIVFKPVWEPED